MKRIFILLAALVVAAACTNAPAPAEKGAIETIMNRKSVRSFTGEKLSEDLPAGDNQPKDKWKPEKIHNNRW